MNANCFYLVFTTFDQLSDVSSSYADDPEDYSDYSDDDDDAIKKFIKKMDRSRFPPNSYLSFCKIIEDDPEDPKDLEDVFDTMRKVEPVTITMIRMVNMLKKNGFMSQAKAIFLKMDLAHDIPEVVTHTGVVEIYAKAYEAKEALKVFVRMLYFGVTPNAYTYSVLIKGLAKDPNFLGDAKKYTLEMMDKGMQPNSRTCIAMFKAFARLKDFKVEKGKEFLKEMKAKGFVPQKKAVMAVLKGKKGPVVKTVINILFGK